MNDQNQNQVPASPTIQAVPSAPQPAVNPPIWKNILNNLKPVAATIFNKFYSNKKIFWPVSIAFGLIFLVIILGLIFGKRSATSPTTKLPTPAPVIQNTPVASASGNIIIDSQNKLNDLKNQINSLDVKQSRLQPPTLNFDIKF